MNKEELSLHRMLKRYHLLRPLHAEYEKLKQELKPLLEDKPEIQIGKFKVTGKWQEMPEKTVPAYKFWRWSLYVELK